MATKLRIEWLSDGFKEILTSAGTQSLVSNAAQRIADRCGEGYTAKTFMGGFGGGRHVGVVHASTHAARLDEAENKTLEKAVNG